MLKKTLKHTGFGFVLGMAMGNIIAGLTGHPNLFSPHLLEWAGSLSAALLWQTFLSGLLGAVAWAGISFYEIESWPLLWAVAVHYASIMAAYLPIAQALGWIENATDALIMAGIMAAAHLMVFLIMLAIYRRQVKELNRLNEERKQQAKRSTGGAL